MMMPIIAIIRERTSLILRVIHDIPEMSLHQTQGCFNLFRQKLSLNIKSCFIQLRNFLQFSAESMQKIYVKFFHTQVLY